MVWGGEGKKENSFAGLLKFKKKSALVNYCGWSGVSGWGEQKTALFVC